MFEFLGPNLVIIVLNDSGYGMIKWKQEGMGLKDFGLDFKNPDFVELAKSFGGKGHRIASTLDFKPTLEKAIAEGTTLKQAALASGKVTEELFDKTIAPLSMVGNGLAGA